MAKKRDELAAKRKQNERKNYAALVLGAWDRLDGDARQQRRNEKADVEQEARRRL